MKEIEKNYTKYYAKEDLSYIWCVMISKWEIITYEENDWFPFSLQKLLDNGKISKVID